ncbi:MAG TPA: hypothetical protein VJ777_31180 [Mycobacterium sp.]|nr:hypothetical protein [Mycobacterium sp.]
MQAGDPRQAPLGAAGSDNSEPTTKPKWYRQLYFWVIVAIIAGVLVGWLAPGLGKAMEPIGTGFIALLRY